ncbi:MAG TPA: L,D-transpeptidase [Thermoanaerobaculia bacterium]
MPRWIGLLGSWALLVLGLGIGGIALAVEWINLKDARRFRRFELVDRMIEQRMAAELRALERSMANQATAVQQLQLRVDSAEKMAGDLDDPARSITISTQENKLYVRESGQTIFESVCSTGKGTTMIFGGRTMVFNTPIGKFRIVSKEENPVWVPPDWHFAEEAEQRGMGVVHLERGIRIDADTGAPASRSRDSGIWSSWFGSSKGGRVLLVKGNTVVEESRGSARELPPGKLIFAGKKIVIPPVGTPQRKWDKVLGSHRLNLGDGYAIHGTMRTDQLGQSVSHGCVRLADEDIARLYAMANVGDEVVIY